MKTIVGQLFSGGHRPDPPEVMASWFAFFFNRGGSRYVGIDSHLPNDYLEEYDWYLTVHGRSIIERSEREIEFERADELADERVIVSTAAELRNSYHNPNGSYATFVKWHEDNHVKLYWISTSAAERIRQDCGLPSGTDVSCWENYAVLFIPPVGQAELNGISDPNSSQAPTVSGGMRLQMLVKDGSSPGELAFEHARKFVRLVEGGRTELGYGPPPTSIVDLELATTWERYVSPRDRLRSNGPLVRMLERELGTRNLILDAAAGIGIESIFLIQELHKAVVVNEVDATFRAALLQYATRHNVKCTPVDGAWEDLPDKFNDGMRFEAILCLGNSMCLVESEISRQLAFQNFHKLLTDDGILIIDERNFDYMIQNRDAILADPLSFPGVYRLFAFSRG